MVYINMQLLRGASPTTCVCFHTNLLVRGKGTPHQRVTIHPLMILTPDQLSDLRMNTSLSGNHL